MEVKASTNQILINNKTYIYKQRLGKGAFGEVYEGYEKSQNQPLAIKQIEIEIKEVETEAELLQNAEREAKLLQKAKKEAKLLQKAEREAELLYSIKNFEHVIKIIDNFKLNSYYYIVTEFMAGGNLGQFINRNIRLSQEQSAQFLRQIVLGIYEIHLRGIIHRDLKPDNILLSSNSQNIILKITDFGLSNQQILAKSDVGSPIYSAPEQREKGKKQSYAVDIWSLGTILYEMVIGKRAFPAKKWGDLKQMWKHGFNYLFWPQDIGISVECKSLIQEMLQLEPLERISLKNILNHPFMWLHQQNIEVQEINYKESLNSIQELDKESTEKSTKSKKQEDQIKFKLLETNEKHKRTEIDFKKLSITEQINQEQFQVQSQVLQEKTQAQNIQQIQQQGQKEKFEDGQFVMQIGLNYQSLQNHHIEQLSQQPQNNYQQQLPNLRENQNFQLQNQEIQNPLLGNSKEEEEKIQKEL